MITRLITNFKAFIGRSVLKLSGWTIVGDFPHHEKKCVMIAAPHTSNWDCPWMLACAWSWKGTINWLGKKEIFSMPVLGPLLKHWGGIAIDRQHKTGYVQAIADLIKSREQITLLVPPEGTRSKTDTGWRTGFYHIANQAHVPIYFAFLDYGQRRLGIGGSITPSGNVEADWEKIKTFYENLHGKFPEKQCELKLKSVN